MLKSTLPFSKARARCWAGTPVSESYLQGRVRLGRALTRSQGLRSAAAPRPAPPRPYQWNSSPRLLAGVTKRASWKHS